MHTPPFTQTFEIASYYHFIHTLALIGVPLTRRPCLVSGEAGRQGGRETDSEADRQEGRPGK